MVTEKRVPSRSRIPGVPGPVEILEIGGKGMPIEIIIRNGKIYCFDETGQTLIDNGIIQTAGIAVRSIAATKLTIGQSAYTHNITHSSLNYFQVYFSAGTLYFANGQTVSVNEGWLNVFNTTYIYYNNSPTLYATTNPANVVGENKVLLAICYPGSDWGQYVAVEWKQAAGTTIDGAYITTYSIIANKLNIVSIDASGYISASYIITGILSVGGSGAVSPGKLSFLDTSDTEYGKINYLGLIFANNKGVFLHNVNQAGEPGLFYMDSSDDLWLRAGLDEKIMFAAQNNYAAFTFDTSTGMIQCNFLGNYYPVGSIYSSGSVILKGAITFWGNNYPNISIPYSFGVTLSGVPLVFGMALGRVVPMNNYETALDTGYTFSTTNGGAAYEKIAQQFTTPSAQNVSCISVLMAKTGTPAGTMVAEIYADSGGLPTGSALGTSAALTINTAVPGTYPGNFGFVGFTFGTPISLSGSTIYHLVIRTIGFTRSAGVTELYWGGDAGGSHTGEGEEYNHGTTTWSSISPATVLWFRIYADNVYSVTQYIASTDFFTVLGEDPTTTGIYLQMSQLEITVNTFQLGTRYAASVGVFGELA